MEENKKKPGNPEKEISLRDYFAAKAMQVFLENVLSNESSYYYDNIPRNSYNIAELMLKERERIISSQ